MDKLRANQEGKEEEAIKNRIHDIKIIWSAAQQSISGLKKAIKIMAQNDYYEVIDGKPVITVSIFPSPDLLGPSCVKRSYQDYNNGGVWTRVLTFTLQFSNYWNEYFKIAKLIVEKDNINLSPYIFYSKDEFGTDETGVEGIDYKIYHESDFPVTIVKNIQECDAGPFAYVYYPDAEESNFSLKIKCTCEISNQYTDDNNEENTTSNYTQNIPAWDCPFCGCQVPNGEDVCPECGDCSYDEYKYITEQIENIKKAQSGNMAAFQTEKQAEVGIAGAEALGHMGENGAGTMNNMMNGVNQQGQAGTTPPPIPTATYYVADNGQATGPYDMNILTQMATSGQLTADSLVWQAGMPDWVKAGTVEELNKLFGTIPPVPPVTKSNE